MVNSAGRRVVFLNGDTAPYSSLTVRIKYSGPRDITRAHMPWTVYHTEPHYFNITEDWGIDDHDCEGLNPKPPEDYFPLVYTSLPADLPFIDKDKLIKLLHIMAKLIAMHDFDDHRCLKINGRWLYMVSTIIQLLLNGGVHRSLNIHNRDTRLKLDAQLMPGVSCLMI